MGKYEPRRGDHYLWFANGKLNDSFSKPAGNVLTADNSNECGWACINLNLHVYLESAGTGDFHFSAVSCAYDIVPRFLYGHLHRRPKHFSDRAKRYRESNGHGECERLRFGVRELLHGDPLVGRR